MFTIKGTPLSIYFNVFYMIYSYIGFQNFDDHFHFFLQKNEPFAGVYMKSSGGMKYCR